MGPHGTASRAIIQYKQKTERRCPMSHTPSPRPLFGREKITSSVSRVDASNVVCVLEDTLKVRKRAASSRNLQNARRAVLRPRRIGEHLAQISHTDRIRGQIQPFERFTHNTTKTPDQNRGFSVSNFVLPNKFHGHDPAICK